MTNFMLLLVLWCLSKPFFTIALIFMVIKVIIKNINFEWY
jgi:uncharacterized membrane protein YhdT